MASRLLRPTVLSSLPRSSPSLSSHLLSRTSQVQLASSWSSTPVRSNRTFSSSSQRSSDANTLLFLEHREGKLNPGSLNALSAAEKIGGDITGVIVAADAEEGEKVVEEASKLSLKKIIFHSSPKLAHSLAEPIAPLLAALVKKGNFTHLIAAHTAVGKNIFPRVSAKLDVAQISDISSVISPNTFTRPIYAGNAIQTVESTDSIKVLTVRTSSFEPSQSKDGAAVEVEKGDGADAGEIKAEWVSESLTKSERPDLGSASRVVSGGRGVKNKENFDSIIIPLADVLGAAVGASRAAVDSGYADNSLQVGQTGKVVAPELYVAVGISGAIQHLAGMKDSKTIVAINKDPEAPIFQVADIGLVADLFDAVPELTQKLKK